MPSLHSTQTQYLPIALSGSCYWCMQAILDQLRGIQNTQIGWYHLSEHRIEVVTAQWDPKVLALDTLLDVHARLLCRGGQHALRHRYPKAIYLDAPEIVLQAKAILTPACNIEVKPLMTLTVADKRYQHLYLRVPRLPFCQRVIAPRIAELKQSFAHALPDTLAE